MSNAVIIALRTKRSASPVSVIALMFLLFPVFSTADDFHVCHLSIAHFFAALQSAASLQSDSHSKDPEKTTVCIACLWSTFESTPPATLVNLEPVPARVECCQIPELPLPYVESFSFRAQRAPPFV
jgi:hypothetical protein